MPDSAGKLYFLDYKNELRARGFDGFADADLGQLVNRGYFHVARRSTWYWEQAIDNFSISPGSAGVAIWPTGPELANFRSLDKVYVTTAGQQKKLQVMDDDKFFTRYLSQDLTSAAQRGEPQYYFVYDEYLYILPPVSATRTFVAYYHQRMVNMVQPNDQPITPLHLDEAIILASLIRCHKRSNEPQLAADVLADLEGFFDDMRTTRK